MLEVCLGVMLGVSEYILDVDVYSGPWGVQ